MLPWCSIATFFFGVTSYNWIHLLDDYANLLLVPLLVRLGPRMIARACLKTKIMQMGMADLMAISWGISLMIGRDHRKILTTVKAMLAGSTRRHASLCQRPETLARMCHWNCSLAMQRIHVKEMGMWSQSKCRWSGGEDGHQLLNWLQWEGHLERHSDHPPQLHHLRVFCFVCLVVLPLKQASLVPRFGELPGFVWVYLWLILGN